jgi:hypothetical protein
MVCRSMARLNTRDLLALFLPLMPFLFSEMREFAFHGSPWTEEKVYYQPRNFFQRVGPLLRK